jgi:SPP1 family predicted phage head-tail adaptor
MNRISRKTPSSYLRHRINIKSKVETADGEGGFSQFWATLSTVWASVDPIQEEQSEYYRSINADTTHVIKVRGETTILSTNKIEFDGRMFDVLAFADMQERGILKAILCKEILRK